MKKKFILCFLLALLFNAKAQDLIPYNSEGKIGFKDTTGKVVINANHKYPDDFYDGLLAARIDKKYGYIDTTGKTVIPFLYDQATTFYKGFAVVQINNAVFIIDKKGKEIKKLKYNSIVISKDDVAIVKLNGKIGTIVKSTGKELIPPIYDGTSRFNKDFVLAVRLGEKWGIISRVGEVILPIQYFYIYSLGENVNSYVVQLGEKMGVLNLDLKGIPELKYDHINVQREGFSVVVAADKYGFIDILGKELTPLKYDFAKHFTEGYATVLREGRWYFLNNRGEELPLLYNGSENFDNVSALVNGFCKVRFKTKTGFINKNRKLAIPLLYDDAGFYHDGLVDVKLNDKWGVIDESGNIIIPIEYDKMDIDQNIIATKNRKDYYFDKNGKPIAKPQE